MKNKKSTKEEDTISFMWYANESGYQKLPAKAIKRVNDYIEKHPKCGLKKIENYKMTKAQASRFSAYQRKIHNLPEISNEAFYTAKELAKELKINIMTIYRYIKAGKLQAYKIGKEFRIDKNEFNKFLDKAKTK